jgi:multimeric flavodoxin WrbA
VATLLVVHHSPSPTLVEMLDGVVDGAGADGLEAVTVEVRPALEATAEDVLDADGYVFGTPANLGYMSGALKHFFDTIYQPCLERTVGRPYGMYLHGHSDTDGARLAIEKITTGLRWRLAQAPVSSLGPLDETTREACWELGAALAAGLLDP